MNATDNRINRLRSQTEIVTGETAQFQQVSNTPRSQRKAPVKVNPVVNRKIVVAISVVATPMAILCDGFSIYFLANVKATDDRWLACGWG